MTNTQQLAGAVISSGTRHQAKSADSRPCPIDLIRSISDPEHPLTLEQLAVVSAQQITVSHGKRPHVLVEFTPTIPHCSMATLIGEQRHLITEVTPARAC